MRALIQRVARAQALDPAVSGKSIAAVGKGLLLLVGFESSDTPAIAEAFLHKIRALRIFSDAAGKMNLCGPDAGAEYLVVSQFTLYADCRGGNRPSFSSAAPKKQAEEQYAAFVAAASRILGADRVKHTAFGSDLHVELVNDGPVTIWLDSGEVL